MQVLITVPRVEVYENEGASFLGEWTKTEVFEYDMMSYIMHRMLHKGLYHKSFVLAFSCRRTIRIRYV